MRTVKLYPLLFLIAFLLSSIQSRAQYCTAYYYYPCSYYNTYIQSFSTSGGTTNISNTNTGCGTPSTSYTYYSSKKHTSAQGTNVGYTIVNNASYPLLYKMWVDFNGDNDFADAGEEVYSGSLSTSGSVNSSFTIPVTATTGTTRLRIRADYFGPVTSCGYLYYGETEDYDFEITAGCPAFVSTPPSDVSVCAGTNSSFTATATGYTSVKWEVNTGSGWSTVNNGGVYSGATTTTLAISGTPVSMNGYKYRCVVTNSSSSCSYTSSDATLSVTGITSTTPSTVCSGSNTSISATSSTGYLKWYNQATGGTLLGSNSTLNITSATTTTTYYAEAYSNVANSLTTNANTSNGQQGAMFDVKALDDISVTALDFTPTGSGTYNVEIWFKSGTLVGSETNQSAWTKVGSASGISVTGLAPYTINLSTPQTLSTGNTYAFYFVALSTSSSSIRYQTVSSGVNASNSDMEIYAGKGMSGYFSGSIFSPRMFTGTVRYEKTSYCSPPNRTGVTVTVNQPPAISTQPVNTATCIGGNASISLTATGTGLTYQWQISTNGGSTWSNVSNGGVYGGANTNALSITGATSGMNGYKYKCLVSGACTPDATSNTITLSIVGPTSISGHPSNKTICAGGNTNLTVTTTGTTPTGYLWQVSTNSGSTWSTVSNGGVYSNATSASLSISNATVSMSNYMYRCVVSAPCITTPTSNAATLTVNALPAITSQPNSTIVCEGANTSFSVGATGTSIAYQWQVSTNGGSTWGNVSNGGVYSNATTSTLNITGATIGMHNYKYRCLVSGTCNPSVTSSVATMSVSGTPVIITQPPASMQICTNATGVLSTTATGINLSYQWQVSTNGGSTWSNVSNGTLYSGATTNALSISPQSVSMNNYQYRCIVSNTCAVSVTSSSTTITVKSGATLTSNPSYYNHACVGDNVILAVSATNTTGYQWQAQISGSWQNLSNNSTYSGVTTNTLQISNVNSGLTGIIYRCIILNSCSILFSNHATIILDAQPAINSQPSSQTICENGGTSFSVGATGTSITYQWQISTNGGSTWSNVSNGGVYTGATNPKLWLAYVPLGYNGYKYRCVISGTCNPSVTSDVVTLTVNQNVSITGQPSSSTICSGGTTSATTTAIGSGISSRQWQIYNGSSWVNITNGGGISGATTATLTASGLTATGSTTVMGPIRHVVTGTCGTATSNSVYLTIHAKPAITTNPSSAVICDGTDHTFYTGANGTGINYQWQVNAGSGWANLINNSTYSGATTGYLKVTAATQGMSGYQYRCVINGTCTPSVTSGSATLTVNPNLIQSVTVTSTNADICAGTKITFTATPKNGGSNPKYYWKVNGSTVSSGTSNTYSDNGLADGDAVYCVMESSAMCLTAPSVTSNAIGIKVTPYSTPSISITGDAPSNTQCSGVPVTFKSQVTNEGKNPTYSWKVNGIITGPNLDSFVTTTLQDGDIVSCDLTSGLKCHTPSVVSSNSIKMKINKTTKSSVVIAAAPDSNICEKTKVTLYTFINNGGALPKYEWVRNSINIPGATLASLVIDTIKNGDVIQCRLISSNLCVFPELSKPIKFSVDPLITPSVNIAVSYNGGNSYTFTAIPVNGGANPTYEWFVNNKKVAGVTGDTYTTDALSKIDKVHVKMASSVECLTPEGLVVSSRLATTGIDNVESSLFNTLTLYPNPNTGQFTITGTLKSSTNAKTAYIKITNSVGQTVHNISWPVSGNEIKVPVNLIENMANGLYMVNIIIGDDKASIRFMLNR